MKQLCILERSGDNNHGVDLRMKEKQRVYLEDFIYFCSVLSGFFWLFITPPVALLEGGGGDGGGGRGGCLAGRKRRGKGGRISKQTLRFPP